MKLKGAIFKGGKTVGSAGKCSVFRRNLKAPIFSHINLGAKSARGKKNRLSDYIRETNAPLTAARETKEPASQVSD